MMKMPEKVLVWDIPTRVFHWLLAASFLTAYITSEGEANRHIHILAGYTVAALVVFRVIWGLIGTKYARFTQFIRSPAAAIRYFKAIKAGNPEHHVGHNPAGALAIIALLLLGIATPLTGWLTYSDTQDVGEFHQLLGNVFLGLVIVHVAAVVVSSILHKENLAKAMVTGKKMANAGEGIKTSRVLVGLLLAAFVGSFLVAGYGGAKSMLGKMPAFAPLFQDNRLEAGDDSGDSSDDAVATSKVPAKPAENVLKQQPAANAAAKSDDKDKDDD
ncbi:cytochrome b/b6 domain-containing protein [Leeia oryzae]|uniref:cytochrome b/b6 domain-containing protein n=1 Tax=Leeia oryzae TaxID=356662 RepID=UPI0012EAC97D|nr:cytochrome b/b6 domain-containing protein [Leeia oryzae]